MKILAAADLHGARGTYSWIAGLAKQRAVDALVLAGDLLAWPEKGGVEAAQLQYAQVVVDMLVRMPCPVLYVMGNDDLVELPTRSQRVVSLHNRRWELGGFNFVGYQYSLPFMDGRFEKSEERIAEDLRGLAPLIDDQTVFVTHSPAHGILDRGVLGLHAGSTSILELIRTRRPRIHIHGHIHECVGREGIHLNVGTYGCRRAVLVDLDSLTDEVIVGDFSRP